MSADEAPSFLARIASRIEALGMSEGAVSMAAFGHHKGIANLRKSRGSPGIESFSKLAPILQTSAPWLAFGAGEDLSEAPARGRGRTLPVLFSVAAGQWQDVDENVDAPVVEDSHIAPDPRWPDAAQFAVLVNGTSINRIADHGSTLACVDTRAIHYSAQDGDLVIVERLDGGRRERTAKRYRRNGQSHELWPDSHDPKWKPMTFTPGEEEDESVSIDIIGLALRNVSLVRVDMPWNRIGSPE